MDHFYFTVTDDAMAGDGIMSGDVVLIDTRCEVKVDDIAFAYVDPKPILRRATDDNIIVIGKVVRIIVDA